MRAEHKICVACFLCQVNEAKVDEGGKILTLQQAAEGISVLQCTEIQDEMMGVPEESSSRLVCNQLVNYFS